MAENLTVQAPEFDKIKKEAGYATTDGMNVLWQVLNAVDASTRRGIRLSQERLEPKLKGDTTTSNQNNYDTEGASVIQFTGGSAIDLTGIKAPEPGKTRIVIVFITGAGTVTLRHASGSSIAENRLSCKTGADTALATGGSAIFIYLSSLYRQIV